MDILILSPRTELWTGLAPVFKARGASLRMAADLDSGLASLREKKAVLAVLDLGMDAETLRKAVISILTIDVMTHTTAVSAMSEEEFHDAMEGLGMLMSLPAQPAPADIEHLMDTLASLSV